MITPDLLNLVDDKGNSTFIPGKSKCNYCRFFAINKNEEMGAAKASQATLILKYFYFAL
jgi:hypothetical protein